VMAVTPDWSKRLHGCHTRLDLVSVCVANVAFAADPRVKPEGDKLWSQGDRLRPQGGRWWVNGEVLPVLAVGRVRVS
jgi:hypothetical protein